MKILEWAFNIYQKMPNWKKKLKNEELIRIVQASCFNIHHKNTRNIDLEKLIEFTFMRSIMIHLANLERPFTKNEVILLTSAIKQYVWFEQAKLIHIQDNSNQIEVDISDVMGLRKEIRILYHKIKQAIACGKDFYNTSELIMVMYEISQKRALRDFFVQSEFVQDFFKKLNLEPMKP